MNPDAVRREVLGFIRAGFPEDYFDMMRRLGDSEYFNRFDNYEAFLADQVRVLDNAPLAQLERYRIAVQDVRNGMILQADRDDNVWVSNNFYLIDGRIVYRSHNEVEFAYH